MNRFEELPVRPDLARQETLELRDFLAAHPSLKREQDLLPFFRRRMHLAAWCGTANPLVVTPNLLAWELNPFGDCACDLAIGDARLKTYSFLAFGDANPDSLFCKQAHKPIRQWSPSVGRGFAQLVDWYFSLDEHFNSTELEQCFGERSIDSVGVLVIGRSQHMAPSERLRWEFRRQSVTIDAKRVVCLTYEELAATILARLEPEKTSLGAP